MRLGDVRGRATSRGVLGFREACERAAFSSK